MEAEHITMLEQGMLSMTKALKYGKAQDLEVASFFCLKNSSPNFEQVVNSGSQANRDQYRFTQCFLTFRLFPLIKLPFLLYSLWRECFCGPFSCPFR